MILVEVFSGQSEVAAVVHLATLYPTRARCRPLYLAPSIWPLYLGSIANGIKGWIAMRFAVKPVTLPPTNDQRTGTPSGM